MGLFRKGPLCGFFRQDSKHAGATVFTLTLHGVGTIFHGDFLCVCNLFFSLTFNAVSLFCHIIFKLC